jgi:hypothetical protein
MSDKIIKVAKISGEDLDDLRQILNAYVFGSDNNMILEDKAWALLEKLNK